MEPDVIIEVEGEDFPLLSQVLMLASPVFGRMLSYDMKEAREGRIVLNGKKKEEFRRVLPFLTTVGIGWKRSTGDIHLSEVPMLLHWGHEYEIACLMEACQTLLIEKEPPSVDALKLALDYNLEDRAEQVVTSLARDVPHNLDALRPYADEAAVMAHLWPAIFRAAGLQPKQSQYMLSPSIGMLWPLIEKAVFGTPVRSKKEVVIGMRVRVIDDLELLKSSCKYRLGWQDKMEGCVGKVGTVVEKDDDDDISVQFSGNGSWFLPHSALFRAATHPASGGAAPAAKGAARGKVPLVVSV